MSMANRIPLRKYATQSVLPLSLIASMLCLPGISDADSVEQHHPSSTHLYFSPDSNEVSVTKDYQVGRTLYLPTTFHNETGMFIPPRIATGVSGDNPGIMIVEFFLSNNNNLYRIESVRHPQKVSTSISVTIPDSLANTLRNRESSLGADVVFDHYFSLADADVNFS